MTPSLNRRARELADRLAADGDALRIAAKELPGGLEAGRRLAEITMAGLGSVGFAPVVLDGRWMPGLTVVTDHPALACLGAQYAGWQIKRDGYFAMASGPGRALIRAEELYDDLDVDEQASASLAGGVQVAAGVVETALHKLHEIDFDVRGVVSGFGTCPLPPVAKGDP